MEQKYVSHSADNNGHTVLELSSSYTPSPALSSSQSSPHCSESSMSSPVVDPLTAVTQNPTVQPDPACLPGAQVFGRKQALKSLKESIPHTMRLLQLQKEERAHHKDAIWQKKSVRRLSKELYLIVSMYAVLQGVLFSAVAQSTSFSCADWWGPVGIVIAVTLGTIYCTLDKLNRMGERKQGVKMFERRQSAVYDKITQLYAKGAECCIDTLRPAHSQSSDPQPGMQCIFSLQGLLVLGFLTGFSFLNLVSCNLMLCHSCPCQLPS